MSESKIIVLPILNRKEYIKFDAEKADEDGINTFTMAFVEQFLFQARNAGFKLTDRFFQDMDFAVQALNSALMRNVGLYHPFQEIVDEEIADAEVNFDFEKFLSGNATDEELVTP